MRDALPRASFVGLTGTPIELRDANTRAVFGDHIRNKPRRETLATRFRDPDDPLQVVLVRYMWLTGFDAPSLYTMYIDKPMRGHGLMQAIARVNRVFKDKPGGLVVDFFQACALPSPSESLASHARTRNWISPCAKS